MLCATACPAHCIDIVGATAPDTWPDREKYCESFVIDELRCIYCGMCEEACPVEAIELTGLYDLTGLSREQMIFDKTKLLSVFDADQGRRADAVRHAAAGRGRRRDRLPPPTELRPDRRPIRTDPPTRLRRSRAVETLDNRDLILADRGRRPRGDRAPTCCCPHRHGAAKPRSVHAVGGGPRGAGAAAVRPLLDAARRRS